MVPTRLSPLPFMFIWILSYPNVINVAKCNLGEVKHETMLARGFTTNRMWGGLGVKQGLSDFKALSQKSMILLPLLLRAIVVVVFCCIAFSSVFFCCSAYRFISFYHGFAFDQ